MGEGEWLGQRRAPIVQQIPALQETLKKLAPPSPRFWSQEQLEWEATRFSEDIISTLNITHPLTKKDHRIPSYRWWTSELKELKARIKRACSLYRKFRTEASYEGVKSTRKEFWKALRRAKRKDWQNLLEEATEPKQVAVVNKIVKAREIQRLGLLRASKDLTCLDPAQSMELLVDEHFPGSSPMLMNQINDPIMCDTRHTSAGFITIQKI